MTLIQHSHETSRWGTPDDSRFRIVSRARLTMGSIDFDPCSEEKFNKTVKATTYFSFIERGEDGMTLPWVKDANTLLNPPGEEKGKPRQNFVKRFWNKMLVEPIKQCIYIGFSMDQLAILADAKYHPTDFSCLFLRNRIPFDRHDLNPGEKGQPSHANFVVGYKVDHKAFVKNFGELGKIIAGPLAVNV